MATDVVVEDDFKIDLIPQKEPALSARSDVPVIETKPDSQPAAEPKADAAPDEGKTPADSAPADQPEDSSADDKPKPKGVQKRIDELVRQREDAERRAEAERQEKLRLLALVEKGPKPDQPKPDADDEQEPQRPTRESFADDGAYASALAEYADQKAEWSANRAVKKALAEADEKAAERQRQEQQKAAVEAYSARVQKATEKYPDYKAVAESPDVQVSMPMAHAIMHSELGPEIAYHLGKNPDEAKRISALQPAMQLMELGLIAAKLTAPAPREDSPPPPPPKPVSAAPKPPKPLTPSSEKSAKDPSEMSMDEYAEYARKRDTPKRPGARP